MRLLFFVSFLVLFKFGNSQIKHHLFTEAEFKSSISNQFVGISVFYEKSDKKKLAYGGGVSLLGFEEAFLDFKVVYFFRRHYVCYFNGYEMREDWYSILQLKSNFSLTKQYLCPEIGSYVYINPKFSFAPNLSYFIGLNKDVNDELLLGVKLRYKFINYKP